MLENLCVKGSTVSFGDDYQVITIQCKDEQHAMLIAEALLAGALKFSSKAE